MNSFWRLCLFLFLGLQLPSIAQEKYNLTAKVSQQPVTIDGQLAEATWQTAISIGQFWQNFPYDTSFARAKTVVRVAQDDNFIYVAAECFEYQPEKKYVISSLRRDFTSNSDLFEVYMDPFSDKTNGFAFGLNPYGVEREGLISGGSNVDYTWDNKWFSAVTIGVDRWTIEMAIPLKTLRFKNHSQQWRINFARVDLKQNERSSWVPIGRVFDLSSLAFSGVLQFEKPVRRNGDNISLIPYARAGTTHNFEDRTNEQKAALGADAKVALSSSLNLDLTVNPDFSQVEVDRQVTNLSRFEIFFPERRQFFVENSDLFSRFGFSSIRPFFSRRIGVGHDPYTDLYKQEPILYGARLSGRVNERWRVGALNMQTARDIKIDLESTNYSTFAVQRQVFARSNIGAILVNKQVFSDSTGEFRLNSNKFVRIVGIDYNLLSRNNKWEGKFFAHKLLTPNSLPDSYAHASSLEYNSQNLYFEWNHEYVGTNYDKANEIGYIQRNHYWRIEPDIGWWIYPKRNKIVNSHGPYAGGDIFFDSRDGRVLDADQDLGWIINFQNSAWLRLFYRNDYTYLFSSFDPTRTDGPELPVGSRFMYQSFRLRFQSNARKVFNYQVYLRAGQYFNGNITSLTGAVNYRIQPYGSIGMDYTLSRIRLPQPYHSANLMLLGPSIDWAFTRKVFLKAVFQYNNQINNFNTNIRFQWRFRPVSDFYIVYTDNYTDQFQVKNRGVVLKLTYWLNL